MKKEFIFSMLLAASLPAAAAHHGRVFVDKNHNGSFDKGEKVLKDVKVSDGLNVVKTDANGMYTLPGHERERFVFITLPPDTKPVTSTTTPSRGCRELRFRPHPLSGRH